MVTVVLSWVVLAEWKLDFIPDHTGSGVLHAWVTNALTERAWLCKRLVDVVLA